MIHRYAPLVASDLLPIFPLQQVVLFPRVHCPLHIFEPRYRQMTVAALRSGGRIGMATVLPDHTDEMAGDPPLFPVGCEGRIVESEQLPNGRYNIVLLGERRFRIDDEPPRPAEQLYRSAHVQHLPDPIGPEDAGQVTALRELSLELVGQLLARTAPGAERRLESATFAEADDVVLLNSLCQLLDLSPPEKQGLLEAEGPAVRGRALVGLLEFRLAELAGGVPGGPRTVH